MNDITEILRERIDGSGLTLDADDFAFQLIAAACSMCCKVSDSGNTSCPPPPALVL